MRTSWTLRPVLRLGAVIGMGIVLAAYIWASQTANSAAGATQAVSAPAGAATVDNSVRKPPQVRSLKMPMGNPSVRIMQPADYAHFWYGDAVPITFVVSAQDGNHNPIPDTSITWTDDVDGMLGTGATLQHIFLSGGTYKQHNVTVIATSVDGKSVSDTITVEIGFEQFEQRPGSADVRTSVFDDPQVKWRTDKRLLEKVTPSQAR